MWNRVFARFHLILTILPDFNPILPISEFYEWFSTFSLYWLVKSYDFTSWIAILTTLLPTTWSLRVLDPSIEPKCVESLSFKHVILEGVGSLEFKGIRFLSFQTTWFLKGSNPFIKLVLDLFCLKMKSLRVWIPLLEFKGVRSLSFQQCDFWGCWIPLLNLRVSKLFHFKMRSMRMSDPSFET